VYDLYAVDNHFGGLGGGHYTAFCRNREDGEWYNYDDSRVSKAVPEAVQVGRVELWGGPVLMMDRVARRTSCSTAGEQRDLSVESRESRQRWVLQTESC
jgi:hypothetical protein